MSASSRAKVLLVDDQEANLIALEAVLEPLGQRLHRAQSGREALRQLLDRDFALILLDVVMPGLDGFETARLIRERERSAQTPIIFLTALSETGLPRLRAYSMGAVDYLVKPFEPEVLRSKVSVFVDLARKSATIEAQARALQEAQAKAHERELARTREEFVVLIPDADAVRARLQLGRLLGRIQRTALPHARSPVAEHVTLSVGAVSVVPPAMDARRALAAADEMLYLAKKEGRNRGIHLDPAAGERLTVLAGSGPGSDPADPGVAPP